LWYKPLVAVLISLAAYNVISASSKSALLQWDLDLFLDTAIAYQKGADPYNPSEVYKVVPTNETLSMPWLYPPHHLLFFSALTKIDRTYVKYAWYGLKLLCCAFLFLIWWRIWGREAGALIFVIASFFIFRNPILTDLMAGNFSIFEQTFIWAGFLFILREKYFRYAVLTYLSSWWKWTLAVFILPVTFQSRKWVFIASLGILLFLFSLQNSLWFFEPWISFYPTFLLLMGKTQAAERLSISWDGNYISVLQGLNYLFQSPGIGAVIYILICMGVLGFSYLLMKPYLWKPFVREVFIRNFSYFTLTYAVLMPRFKTYNAILIIPGLLQCWILVKSNKVARNIFIYTLIAVSFSGVAYQRTDLITRLYNFRFSAALLIFWALFAYDLLGRTYPQWRNKLHSLRNIEKPEDDLSTSEGGTSLSSTPDSSTNT
jgi:hypothetical protein